MSWSRKPRVIIDTNVFISGVLFGGLPEKVLNLVKQGKLKLIISPEVEAEILNKFLAFKIGQEMFADIKFVLEEGGEKVIPSHQVKVCRDPRDNIFLAATAEAEADFLITGDKDLLSLKMFKQTQIITPRQLLDLLSDRIS